MSSYKGKYIVLEGIDGSGTTTQCELLRQTLEKAGHKVIVVTEPGGTPIGQALRTVIKDGNLKRSPQTNFDLFNACRRELVEQVILPSLEKGQWVISDRNWYSSVAYQGFGEGMPVSEIVAASRRALGPCSTPDLALILDIPPELAAERRAKRLQEASDIFDQKGLAFFEKARQGYLHLAREYSLSVIDGSRAAQEVHTTILQLVSRT